MRVLVDTCVLVDSLQDRKPFSESANKILIAVAQKRIDACITAKAVTDVYYLMHRYTHSDAQSRKVLSKLFLLYEVLDTQAMDCRRAITGTMPDYEDAVMAETAIRSGVDAIVTRNERDYTNAGVRVMSPDALVQLLESDLS